MENNKNEPMMPRRSFLRYLGRAGAVMTGASLDALVGGCVPTPKETPQDVAAQVWDCNPNLSIPTEGCYIGTNEQVPLAIQRFESDYGVRPTFWAPGAGIQVNDARFESFHIKQCIEQGVVPVLRYVPSDFRGYQPIVQGSKDREVHTFFAELARFRSPIVVIPFQHPNDSNSRHYPWAAQSSSAYKDAWVRIHSICQQEGASKVLFSTKMKMLIGKYPSLDPFDYTPPAQYVDILGWACNNHFKPNLGIYSESFRSFFWGRYEEAARRYPNKPQMFWELSSLRGPGQAQWMDDALTRIREDYPRVKGVMLDENFYGGVGDSFGSADPTPNEETIKIIRKHFNSGYFISKPLLR